MSRSDFDIFGASLTLTWDFGAASIKSITAYRDLDSEFARDGDGSPFLVVGTEDIYDQEQFSQELQLYGTSSGGRLSWVTGFFYLDEEGVNQNAVPTSIGDVNSGGAIDNTTWALFGHVSFDFTDRFGAALGVRFTDETKGFTPGFPPPQEQFFASNANGLALGLPPIIPLLLVADNEADSDNTDYTASLQYSFTPDLLTYASYSTGHKSGGFSQRIPPSAGSPLSVPPSFETEEVTVYEVGLKWIGWGNRLRINTAAFFTDYDDIQITPLFEGIGPVTRNAGEAEIQGAEFEWLLLPGPNWEWSGGIGWLETEYTQLTPESQVNLNLDGTPVLTLNTELANSPEWSINSSLAYTWDVSASGVIKFRIDWTYTDELFNDVLNAVELTRDAINLVGASIVYQTKDGNWEVSLNGRNLADETYLISGNAERYAGNIGYTQGVYARPRDWWVGLRRNF